MKFTKLILLSAMAMITGVSACIKETVQESLNGSTRIEITDGPVDDNKVSGVYITVSAILIDGVPVSNFNPVTFDLKALNNGKTKLLTDVVLTPKNYSELTLVLSYDKDDSGAFPGSYVLDQAGNKHALNAEFKDIKLNYSFIADPAFTNNLLIDVDLRKALIRSTRPDDNYDFPYFPTLVSAFKIVDKDQSGSITGIISNIPANDEKVIVYAYKTGTYNDDEYVTHGDQPIEFSNSVKSSEVDATGTFKFNFLEKGDYELHFAKYIKDASGEKYEIDAIYTMEPVQSSSGKSVKVTPNANTNVEFILTGELVL